MTIQAQHEKIGALPPVGTYRIAIGEPSIALTTRHLTVRGLRHPLRLTVSGFSGDENRIGVRVHADLDRHAHGITAPKGLAGRWLHRETTLAAERDPAADPESPRTAVPAAFDDHADATRQERS